MTIRNIIVAVAFAASVSANADTYGHWYADDISALTRFTTGIDVGVTFHPSTGCHDATFVIYGNQRIKAIAINIDGRVFSSDGPATYRGDSFVGWSMADGFLSALKHGNSALIVTDQGDIRMSLKGSAAAFLKAWENCEFQKQVPSYDRLLRAI